ncbi:MAG: FecR domain-containing protein [Gemmatimonadaceae bacterium]|nr:FecR domain-containing protein [Gemmatimonadaceae bacterium]
MHDEMIDWNRLARYFAGECSPAEADAIRAWAAEDPARSAELALLRKVWARAGELPAAPRIEAMWEAVVAGSDVPRAHGDALIPAPPGRADGGRVRVGRALSLMPPTNARPRWATLRVTAIAAALVIAAFGGRTAWRQAHRADGAPHAAAVAVVREYRTARGQRATIELLDGTHVTLGVDSRLRTTAFEGGRRDVFLDGEAVFDVVHDARRPFLVHAGSALAQDIGTTFSVRAYAGEPVRIVVADGSVAVGDTIAPADPRTVLGARDMARVQRDGRIVVARGIDPRPYLAWTSGRLVFRHVPLRAVVSELERWFDVRITVADSALLDATVNASFHDDGIDDVLQLLTTSLDARVERRGRMVVLHRAH